MITDVTVMLSIYNVYSPIAHLLVLSNSQFGITLELVLLGNLVN